LESSAIPGEAYDLADDSAMTREEYEQLSGPERDRLNRFDFFTSDEDSDHLCSDYENALTDSGTSDRDGGKGPSGNMSQSLSEEEDDNASKEIDSRVRLLERFWKRQVNAADKFQRQVFAPVLDTGE
jgi:hypothetical protein